MKAPTLADLFEELKNDTAFVECCLQKRNILANKHNRILYLAGLEDAFVALEWFRAHREKESK